MGAGRQLLYAEGAEKVVVFPLPQPLGGHFVKCLSENNLRAIP